MKPPHIQRVQVLLYLLERVLSKSPGGWADYDALCEFRRLCWASLVLADDAECQKQIEVLVQYGNDLFSDHDHQRWQAAPLSGVDTLRLNMKGCLASLRARLDALQRAHGTTAQSTASLPNWRAAAA